jgi:hypothetical protein
MVFTVPMHQHATRRAVLAGLAGGVTGAALAGCWPASDKPAVQHPPHPLTPVLASTGVLVQRYRATIAGYPDLAERLTPLLADHEAHVEALHKAIGTPVASASASPGPSVSASLAPDAAGAVAALRRAEQTGQADAVTACLAAASDDAALLGSIAACRATHLEVLTP